MPVLRSRRPTGLVLGVAAATFCGAWPLVAQGQTEGRVGPVWTVEGLRAGQCVRFLMDPAAAAKELHPGARLVRADQDQGLHTALRSAVAGQPEFAAWIPASLCLYYADAIQMGPRRLGSKDARRSRMLGLWTIAATQQGGARRDIVVGLFGTGGDLVRAAEQGKVKVREAHSSISKAPGTDNDLYSVQLGKTRLVWNGRAAGDSLAMEQPIEELWLTTGASGTLWRVRATFRPAWTRSLVGLLSVEGKDDLAKALKGSPTRFVGPLYIGGGGELRFSR